MRGRSGCWRWRSARWRRTPTTWGTWRAGRGRWRRGAGRALLSGRRVPAPPPPDVLVREGDSIPLGNVAFRVLHTPGHTPGHVTYLSGDLAFVGDLIFAGSIGRTELPGCALYGL